MTESTNYSAETAAFRKLLKNVKADFNKYKEREDNFIIGFFKNSILTEKRKHACNNVLKALNEDKVISGFEKKINPELVDVRRAAKFMLEELKEGIRANDDLTRKHARKKNPNNPEESSFLHDGPGKYSKMLANYRSALEDIKSKLDEEAEKAEKKSQPFYTRWFGIGR